jgi:hypothetical protein
MPDPLELPHNRTMSSNNGDGGQPPLSQKIVGAIFFILPIAFIVVFLCWCWRRHQRSQEERWAGLVSVVAPQSTSIDTLPTAPELHSARVQLEVGRVKQHWSDIKVRRHHPVCSPGSEFNMT